MSNERIEDVEDVEWEKLREKLAEVNRKKYIEHLLAFARRFYIYTIVHSVSYTKREKAVAALLNEATEEKFREIVRVAMIHIENSDEVERLIANDASALATEDLNYWEISNRF